MFADDTATWTQGKNKEKDKLADSTQKEVDKIAAWAEKWKMSINADKTKCLILSSNNADHSWNPHLTIDQTPIDAVKETKFLGITIDSGLRFTK